MIRQCDELQHAEWLLNVVQYSMMQNSTASPAGLVYKQRLTTKSLSSIFTSSSVRPQPVCRDYFANVVRTVHGLFVHWTVCTVDCSHPPGLFVPWTIRTVPGRFVPCWERQHSLYSVSQPPPEVFWHFFPKRLGIFSPSFAGLLDVHTYGRLQIFCSIISNFDELIYHIKCDHPACVSANGGHFEHTVWW